MSTEWGPLARINRRHSAQPVIAVIVGKASRANMKQSKPSSWGECYYNKYEKYFGGLLSRSIFRQSDDEASIQILVYDNIFGGCRSFCSLGLTHFNQQVSGIGGSVQVRLTKAPTLSTVASQWDYHKPLAAQGDVPPSINPALECSNKAGDNNRARLEPRERW